MIRAVVGQQGTGKTRKMVDMANRALDESNGEIAFVNGDSRNRLIGLNYNIRFINTSEFGIKDLKVFYGFLSGIIAMNYDINEVYIDGILDITKGDLSNIEQFLFGLKKLSDKFNIDFIITINGNPDSIPDSLQEFIA